MTSLATEAAVSAATYGPASSGDEIGEDRTLDISDYLAYIPALQSPTITEARSASSAIAGNDHTGSAPDENIPSNPATSRQPSGRSHPAHVAASAKSTVRTLSLSPTGLRQRRKPSPGLAARLKALSFGSARRPLSSQSQHLEPGRLPEDRIRKIDQNHLASSIAQIIERRGQPWKGPLLRVPSLSTLRSVKSARQSDWRDEEAAHEKCKPTARSPQSLAAISLTHFPMDTLESRLPDHVNGNENKVQLVTREEPINGDTTFTPESPDEPPVPPAKDTPPLPQGLGTSNVTSSNVNENDIKAQLVIREEHLHGDTTCPPESPDAPPAPPAKDTSPLPQGLGSSKVTSSNDIVASIASSYCNPLGLQRPGSIYTLSRVSFASQLAQLTSIQLPDAESLSSKVAAIPTAQLAAKALVNAAEQIRGWIDKAGEVIDGLEIEDDVEWAAAGGREGVEEVESAIMRFEELINVYVSAIEELQSRRDITQVYAEDLEMAVTQMDAILQAWFGIRKTLNYTKAQVETAMEWEELWSMVLGDIQNEMEDLGRLVFEMEERRHRSIMVADKGDAVDIMDLQTIVEERPAIAVRARAPNSRFGELAFPGSPSSSSADAPPADAPAISLDDSSLLALFARMQPLRASLDFLPMRLSVFAARASGAFPTACEELEMRRAGLDASYRKLEQDAESLRKELGEDRWVLVFRGAGRQAQKMYGSVERSLLRLQEAVESGMHLTNPPAMSKKMENYDAKKTHYGPAIERVLSIIDKGVKDRLTVNGEIVRLHNEMQSNWGELKERMAETDAVIEDIQAGKRGQQFRDSASSMLSNDRSTTASGGETPGSSPPSSVIMSSLGYSKPTLTPKNGKALAASTGHYPKSSIRRQSALPTPGGQIQRKPVASATRQASLTTPVRAMVVTPTGNNMTRPASTLGQRPRWNSSTNTADIDTGHNFKPLSLTMPSPYAKNTPTTPQSISSVDPSPASRLPRFRSPLSRSVSALPSPDVTPPRSTGKSRLSFRDASPPPNAQLRTSRSPMQTLAAKGPRLASQAFMSAVASQRNSLQPPGPDESLLAQFSRPASSSSLRQASFLPKPKVKVPQSGIGWLAPRASSRLDLSRSASAVSDVKAKDTKPRWRG